MGHDPCRGNNDTSTCRALLRVHSRHGSHQRVRTCFPAGGCHSSSFDCARMQGPQFQAHHSGTDRSASPGDYFRGVKRHRTQHHGADHQHYLQPSSGSASGNAATAQPDRRLLGAAQRGHAAVQGDRPWHGQNAGETGAPSFHVDRPPTSAVGSGGHAAMIGAAAAPQNVGFGRAQSVPEGDVCWVPGASAAQESRQPATAVVQMSAHGHSPQHSSQGQVWGPGFGREGGGYGSQQGSVAQQVNHRSRHGSSRRCPDWLDKRCRASYCAGRCRSADVLCGWPSAGLC